MNSEDAKKIVDGLAAEGKVVRLSSPDRNTKAIVFQTLSKRNFAVEINDVTSRRYAAKSKIVCERAPNGIELSWQEIGAIGGVTTTDQQFESSAYKTKGLRLEPGKQKSTYVEDENALRQFLDWYGSTKTDLNALIALQRVAVEAAMDAYDRYLATGEYGEVFERFGEPRDYWVRSTRARPNRVYPSKPINFWANGQTPSSGGWGGPTHSAAALHNVGFIIVDESDKPAPVPENRSHLIRDADRIRACALNYYIAPARERAEKAVSIRAGTLNNEMGLNQAWPNVCQALAGKKFQEVANVPAPTQEGPDQSTSTTFTYRLQQDGSGLTMETVKPHMLAPATNLILYGPPGTGKTYASAFEAVRLCLGGDEAETLKADRSALMKVYRELEAEGRIEFVTFHQSFSYEDFVEGLRPSTDGPDADDETIGPSSGGFSLIPHDGVFKRISERARLDTGNSAVQRLDRTRTIFKIALGQRGSQEERIREGLDSSLVHLGWGGDIDWSDVRFENFEEIRKEWNVKKDPNASGKDPNIEMTYAFRSLMQIGDYVVVSDGRDRYRAFGQITGEYEFDPNASFHPHRRKLEWLWKDDDGSDRVAFYPKNFRRQSVYRLQSAIIDWDALEEVVLGNDAGRPTEGARSHVLIIDEINRANISKVFGELITLLEVDKRLGALNEVTVRLPYSGVKLGVPANLHIIGTMNTADRSIALLDTALRRRFKFRELMPDPLVLSEDVEGIDLRRLLTVMNDRIEYLFDREHQIGHAYFTRCGSAASVEAVMRYDVIPLLAEYFYEDWTKIALVLGDTPDGSKQHFLEAKRLVPTGFEDTDENGDAKVRWRVKGSFDFSEFKSS